MMCKPTLKRNECVLRHKLRTKSFKNKLMGDTENVTRESTYYHTIQQPSVVSL